MIMPRTPHTNIGDSEHPGGMKTYCSPQGRYSGQQGRLSLLTLRQVLIYMAGQLPADFWRNVEFKSGRSKSGARYAQCECLTCIEGTMFGCSCRSFTLTVTGCIRPEKLSRLNPSDAGGQYDSSGGVNGQGNPQGSVCLGCVPFASTPNNGPADALNTVTNIT
jgi:hypothetical protein